MAAVSFYCYGCVCVASGLCRRCGNRLLFLSPAIGKKSPPIERKSPAIGNNKFADNPNKNGVSFGGSYDGRGKSCRFFVKTHIAKCGRVKRTFAIFFKFFLFSLEKNPTFVAENTFSDRRYLATVVL
ncbi:MAG: hypothetical protein KBS75_03230 [Bacteroidales bacterium]|nr:hypothetical protein [Candidatus Equimonas faecalis]